MGLKPAYNALESTRKEHLAPYPGRPSLQHLVNQENSVLCIRQYQNFVTVFFILLCCNNQRNLTRSTRVTYVLASDLAVTYTVNLQVALAA